MSKKVIIKKMAFISLATLIFGLCFTGCSTDKTITEEYYGGSIRLDVNDVVEIRLQSNPTTGYSWFLEDGKDNNIVLVTGPEFIESKKEKDIVGAGGHEIFTVKALSKGETSILLNYKRLWEEEEEPIKTFEITISVD